MSDNNKFTPALSETEIAKQLKELERVFQKHNKMLIGWLTNKLGERDAALDIAQDAYLRIWRYAHKNKVENAQALLFKTAANLTVNEFKARKRYVTRHTAFTTETENDNPLENLPSDDPSPERATLARDDVEISINAIETLPENIRRAFIMNRFEGLSYREIAEKLGVSVSSIEKYMITALKTLRAALSATKQGTSTIVPFPDAKRRQGIR
ncbi:MAG: RNA polymerase sigma factor [Pseudomonadota bacterium]